ncbi:GerMN domain-containing protein [Desulfofalx alkaliphila]|uniref:GerMN domain-containing protein n=1 Tax=Desulfofalx alkaliphila TaxID=105483 RepID=UPI00068CEA1B|nr:GerMN domain-containing protein [Desulfofalx alkaliphila]
MKKKILWRCLTILALLMLAVCLTACGSKGGEEGETAITITPTDEPLMEEPTADSVTVLSDMVDKVNVVLFFANDQGYLVPQNRDVPKVDGLARVTMQELAKGPEANSGLLPTLPPGTQLRDINIRDGLCTVDFTGELKENHPGGSSSEMLTVYSIVNTLTQFASVDRVEILVNGQRIESLGGHLNLMETLERDEYIISSQ